VVRLLKLVGAAFAGALYLWIAAVRNLPRVRRRKAGRRPKTPG
jgi:hypothetical protein